MNILNDIPQGEFVVPVYLDYLATFTWATSGAIVGARLRYDVVGVFVIALVSSMGGGLMRDGLFLQRTPSMLTNGTYLVLVAIATLLVALASRKLVTVHKSTTVSKFVELIDAFGTPAFAIVGMQMALAAHVSLPGVVLIGVINGVGGGMFRDVISGRPVAFMLPGQYSALIVVIACTAFVTLTQWQGTDPTPTGVITVLLFCVVRALTIRFNWRSRPVLQE